VGIVRITDWKTEVRGEKPVPVPPCEPQKPHILAWDQILASPVRGQQQALWFTAWPVSCNHEGIH